MADLVLSIVGIVPVIVDAIKLFKEIRAGVRTARKYAANLEEIEVDFSVQWTRFLNECVLLLRQAGENDCGSMARDHSHPGWDNDSLDDRIGHCLAESYGACKLVMDRIVGIQTKINAALFCFKTVRTQRKKVSYYFLRRRTLIVGSRVNQGQQLSDDYNYLCSLSLRRALLRKTSICSEK
jgi:hypothetical protein